MNQGMPEEVATIAGGCFWCIEAVFLEVDGVKKVIPGYTGGTEGEEVLPGGDCSST
jgi:peptide-methionine (S)-S-oxide reductase